MAGRDGLGKGVNRGKESRHRRCCRFAYHLGLFLREEPVLARWDKSCEIERREERRVRGKERNICSWETTATPGDSEVRTWVNGKRVRVRQKAVIDGLCIEDICCQPKANHHGHDSASRTGRSQAELD